MSFLLVILSMSFAIDLQPTAEQPVCLQRLYSNKHMAENPKQKLRELTVKLEEVNYTANDTQPAETYTYNIAKVVGRSAQKKKYFANTAGCTINADGSAHCFIECDGGSFTLAQRPSWINFVVTKDYYFPLFEGVLEPDIEKMQHSIHLDGNDSNNNIFRLEQVPVERCDEAISKVEETQGGC